MSEYTGIPWYTEDYIVKDGEGNEVADTSMGGLNEQSRKRAQLIAAAPGLLEELEEGNEAVWRAIAIIEEIEEKYEIFDTDNQNELDGLKAHLKGTSIGFEEAIAKAKGDTDG